jgi:hypothetical protein
MTSIKTPVNVNQRMSRWPIALILTVCYWIGAALMATLTPRGGWIDLGWPIAIFLFAIPITILLWLIVMGVHFLAPALSRSRFSLIGFVLPVAYVALAAGGGNWWMKWHAQRLEAQLRAATLTAFEDEPLIVAQGTLGVRLRFRVLYPLGLNLDVSHGAFSQLVMIPSRSEFVMMRRVVTPPVSGRFDPGTYEITEEFVPAFLPPSLLYAPSEPAAADHCFRWSPNLGRQEIVTGSAERRTVAMFLSHRAIQRSTTRSYRLADFYATAVRAGAVECAS